MGSSSGAAPRPRALAFSHYNLMPPGSSVEETPFQPRPTRDMGDTATRPALTAWVRACLSHAPGSISKVTARSSSTLQTSRAAGRPQETTQNTLGHEWGLSPLHSSHFKALCWPTKSPALPGGHLEKPGEDTPPESAPRAGPHWESPTSRLGSPRTAVGRVAEGLEVLEHPHCRLLRNLRVRVLHAPWAS